MLILSLLLTLSSTLQLGTNVPEDLNNSAHTQVKCIMQHLSQPYELIALPWLRARQELRLRRIDGYYTAILLNEMVPFGQLSAPLYLENWYWFEPKHLTALPRENRQHGVIRGSHQVKWYESMGITPAVQVNTAEELLQLVKRQRVDTILMDLEAFEETAQKIGLTLSEFSSEFFRYVPLGVYFSTTFLEQSPDFLSRFNQSIPDCTQTPFSLSPREQTVILDSFLSSAQQLAGQPALLNALSIANRQKWREQDIIRHDMQWVQEITNQVPGLAESMLQSELSSLLQHWQQPFNGRIAEIILTDQQGRNVAISELTSDFWQGDEAKFQNIYQSNQRYFFDDVSFDSSSQRFLVHLSIPVKDQHEQELGVLILGIDVELSLQQCQHNSGIANCI